MRHVKGCYVKYFLCILFYIVSMVFADAGTVRYFIDKDNSDIKHTTYLFGFISTTAQAKNYSGYIDYDNKNPENSHVLLRIKASSVSFDVNMIDNVLHGSYFLDSENYEWVVFKSKDIKLIKPKVMLIKGNLVVKGVKRQAVMQVNLSNMSIDKREALFTGSLFMNRSNFNIGFGYPIIGQEVVTHLDIAGSVK